MVVMGKWKKKYKWTQRSNTPFLDTITTKKIPNAYMRILGHFLDSDKVKQRELIKELYDKIESDPARLFIQKLGLKIQFWQIRKNYGIYIRTISDEETYCKILTTKEEFESLLERIERREDAIAVEKANVKEILNDLTKYRQNVSSILSALRDRDKNG